MPNTSQDACSDLAAAAARIAEKRPTPRQFLVELGAEVGGVRTGPLWVRDAATGGSNQISGGGFREIVDDGTAGQARHFAGIVAVAARVGPRMARWASINVGRDEATSADGRLSDLAIVFTARIRSGELALPEAADWIRENICAGA